MVHVVRMWGMSNWTAYCSVVETGTRSKISTLLGQDECIYLPEWDKGDAFHPAKLGPKFGLAYKYLQMV